MKRIGVTLFIMATAGGVALAAPPPAEREFIATGPLARAERGTVVQLTPTLPPPTNPTYIEGRCVQWESLLSEHSPGWDVLKMSKIMWRESRCFPEVRSRTSDTGLLQINDINHKYLRTALGEHVDRWTLTDPVQNVRAAAALYVYWHRAVGDGYQPWEATR